MPLIYQGTCGECGHETPVMTDGYVAVFTDGAGAGTQAEVAGAVVDGGEKEVAGAGDPQLAVSGQAAESPMKGTGYSRSDLFWQGRHVSVANVVCRRCGTLFQRRRLTAPSAMGCGAGTSLGIVGGIAIGLWTRRILVGVVVAYIAIVGFLMLIGFLGRFYVRTRFSARAGALAAESVCPNCHADDARSIAGANSVKCRACGKEAVEFKVVGVS